MVIRTALIALLVVSPAAGQDRFMTNWFTVDNVLQLVPADDAGGMYEIPVSMDIRWVYDIEPFQSLIVSAVETTNVNLPVNYELEGFSGNVELRDFDFDFEFQGSEQNTDLNPSFQGNFESSFLDGFQFVDTSILGNWDNFTYSNDFYDEGLGEFRLASHQFTIYSDHYPATESMTVVWSEEPFVRFRPTAKGRRLTASLEPKYVIQLGDSFETMFDGSVFELTPYEALQQTLPLKADINGDLTVDAQDLNILAQHWQMETLNGLADGDVDQNGFIDAADLNIMALDWNTPTGAATVPEPSGLVLTLFATLTLSIRSFA